MFRYIIFTLMILTQLHGFMATDQKEQCLYIKKLPAISKAFYKKFNDPKSTLELYRPYEYLMNDPSRLSCLDDMAYERVLDEYANILVLNRNESRLKQLAESHPQKTFLLKRLGDLYRANAASTDKQRLSQQWKDRFLALETYKTYIKKGGFATRDILAYLDSQGLVKAKNRWFEKFNVKEVPVGSFKAIYFNDTEPDKIVKETRVPYPAVNFSDGKVYGKKIPPQDFAAYWVGDFIFDKDTVRTFNFSLSWSEFRLIIDGYEVAKSVNSTTEVPFFFSKGKHRIEVEYLCNYGSADFMMTMFDQRKTIDLHEVKNTLGDDDYLLLYAGVYESDNFNRSLRLKFEKQYQKPVVLLLYSYGNVHWKIDTGANNVKAVFVNSYEKGSLVDLSKPKDANSTEVYALKNFRGEHSLRVKCDCSSSYSVHCEGTALSEFDKRVQTIFGKPLDGYTTLYPKERNKNKTLPLPNVVLNEKVRESIANEEKEANVVKYECERQLKMGIDDIF